MEKDTRSYNSRLDIVAKQFLIPSVPTILLYLLISTMVLILWNAKAIWKQFSGGITIHGGDISTLQATWLEKVLSDLGRSRITQFVFWALAGCVVYICVWFVINVVTNLRNDVVADEYIHPINYSHAGYWRSIIARKVFLAGVFITLIGAIIASLRITPVLAGLFYTSLEDFKPIPGLVEIIGSIVGMAFLVYVLILLVHISVNSWRSVYSDL